MVGWFLSFLPRRWLTDALLEQWLGTLNRGERARFYAYGATGNRAHHEFAWADQLPKATSAKPAETTAA